MSMARRLTCPVCYEGPRRRKRINHSLSTTGVVRYGTEGQASAKSFSNDLALQRAFPPVDPRRILAKLPQRPYYNLRRTLFRFVRSKENELLNVFRPTQVLKLCSPFLSSWQRFYSPFTGEQEKVRRKWRATRIRNTLKSKKVYQDRKCVEFFFLQIASNIQFVKKKQEFPSSRIHRRGFLNSFSSILRKKIQSL